MVTTVQVSGTTKQMLERVKEEEAALSYNEVIERLLRARLKVPASMFGSMKGMTWKKERDRGKFREL